MVEQKLATEEVNTPGFLILVRHGTSKWNSLGLWTGLVDIDLDKIGVADAREIARSMVGLRIDVVYTSELLRAKRTLDIILEELDVKPCIIETSAINERNYGVYTARNKWELKEELGDEEFQLVRRSWDARPPGGQSLKDVHSEVSPFLCTEVIPRLMSGQNVLVVAHGNSIRAGIKDIEGLTEDDIANKEVGIGEVLIYHMDSNGEFILLELRGENPNKGSI